MHQYALKCMILCTSTIYKTYHCLESDGVKRDIKILILFQRVNYQL